MSGDPVLLNYSYMFTYIDLYDNYFSMHGFHCCMFRLIMYVIKLKFV